jgi:HEAT repeat protein
MNEFRKILCVAGLALLAAGCPTHSDQTTSAGVFTKDIPKDLATETSDRIAGLSKKSPLAPEAAKGVRDTVAAINLKRPPRKCQEWSAIRKVGAPAIPTIADLLTSPDEDLRRKAISAVGCLQKPKERVGEPGYEETEALLILLYRRSLLDRSVMVRRAAMAGLSGIGWQRARSIPEGVKVGLEQAARDDPDRQNREMAQRFREYLKLAPPNPDPKKRIIVN